MSNPENKIENTFARSMDELNKLEKAFQPGKGLERAIMDVGGDPSYLSDVAEALSTAYEMLEAAHYGAMGHLDDVANESATAGIVAEGVLDSDDEDGFMARSQLYFLAKDAISLHGAIDDRDDLEPWVQTKIVQASKDIDAVRRYTEYNAMKDQVQPEMAPEIGDMGMEEAMSETVETDGRNRGSGADLKPSQIQKLDKTGKNPTMRRYVNKKLAVDAKMNKANDPAGEKKGLGPAVVDKKKAQDKADKRKTNEEKAANDARRKEYNEYQKSKRNESVTDVATRFTMQDFLDNEDVNAHTENAVALADQYGDDEDKAMMMMISAAHSKRGSIEPKEYAMRNEIVKKLLPQLEQESSVTESDDTTEYGIVRYPDTAISYIKKTGAGWEHMYDKSYGFEGPLDKADLQYAKKINADKVPARLKETSDLDEGKLAGLALAALLGWGSMAALDATSAKHSPLGQALAYAAEQGDTRAEKLYNNIDAYAEHNAGTLHNWKVAHEDLVSQFNESDVNEGMEFDDNNNAALKTVATDMFKNALGAAKKKAKKG